MKKLFFLLFLLAFTNLFSQKYGNGFCYTGSFSSIDEIKFKNSVRKANIENQYCLKVYIHVIRKPDGSGGQTEEVVYNAMNYLRESFNPHGIDFYWDETINYFNAETLEYYLDPFISFDIFNSYLLHNDDGINIFLYSNESEGRGGKASGVGYGNSMFVSSTASDTSTVPMANTFVISHEMGHLLNLWHTSHGTFHEGPPSLVYYDADQCPELIDGSNSSTCGDYIEDTPADPHMNINVDENTCEWDGTPYSSNYQYNEPVSNYNPDTSQIMSYTHPFCMTGFSEKQGIRMRQAIAVLPHLQSYVVQNCGTTSCSEFPKVYSGFSSPGDKQHPFSVLTDSENNLIVSGKKSTPFMTFEGQVLPYDNFVAKFKEDGCLLWVKEVNGINDLFFSSIIDSEDNIIINSKESGGVNRVISKYDKNGTLLWQSNASTLLLSSDSSNNIYTIHEGNIIKINSNGNSQIISTGIPSNVGIASNFMVSNNQQEAYIKIATHDSSSIFNFAGNVILNNRNFYILKYRYNGTTLLPSSSSQVGYGSTHFNKNNNHIIINNLDTQEINILDNNLSNILSIDRPHANRSHLNIYNNKLLLLDTSNNLLHTLEDNGSTSFETIELQIRDVGSSYPKLAQSPNGKIYLAGTKPPLYEHYISKIDPNTGLLLSRSNEQNLKKNITQYETKTNSKTQLIKVSPNPFSDIISIEFLTKENHTISLQDSYGRILITQNTTKKNLNLSNIKIPSGIYFLRCSDSKGNSEVKKLIKE